MDARRGPGARKAWTEGSGHTVDRVMDYILERIHSGEYGQGEQIVARTIAKELDLSVAPVREAIHRLSGEGVIELFSNRSARVRQLSIDDILDALEVWEVHAGLTARLVAERIKIRDNSTKFRKVAEALRKASASGDKTGYYRQLVRFQEVMSEIADNPYVEAVRKRLHTEFWSQQMSAHLPPERWPDYFASFDHILPAILSGDPRKAEKAYASHVHWVAEVLRGSDLG